AQQLLVGQEPHDDPHAALLGELDRVLDEVDQDLLYPRRVRLDRLGQRSLELDVEREPLLGGVQLQEQLDVEDDAVRPDAAPVELELAGLDAREIEDVVDDLEEIEAVAAD